MTTDNIQEKINGKLLVIAAHNQAIAKELQEIEQLRQQVGEHRIDIDPLVASVLAERTAKKMRKPTL